MVQDIERTRPSAPSHHSSEQSANGAMGSQFPATAPAANAVFYRTYSRRSDDPNAPRESWIQVCDRTLKGLVQLGDLTVEEAELIQRMQRQIKALPSGRWLWVGGTEWIERPENFNGAYNCTSTNVVDWQAFGLMMNLAMMGCGTGAILENHYIEQLPSIRNRLNVRLTGEIGTTPAGQRRDETEVVIEDHHVTLHVGDSRVGWVKSYQTLLELSTDERFGGEVSVNVDLSDVRPAGEKLKGFGGVANPIRLPELYGRCANILNKAVGRQLNSIECCLLIDEAAVVVVAGNVRRCLPEYALVHTDHGLVPIREIKIGDRVQTPNGFRRVVNTFDQGIQEVRSLNTNSTPPEATLKHRHAVFASATGEIEWKQVAEIEEGDRLVHNSKVLPGKITHLPPDFTSERPAQSRTCTPITIPDLDHDIAWLIGFTHGDGYVSLGRNKYDKPYGGLSWAMNGTQPELSNAICEKLNRALAKFGVKATIAKVKNENTITARCTSIRLAEYFHAYIKQPKAELQVPAFILQGTSDIRAAYLAGLMDSDGSHGKPPILVTSIYKAFVRQVASVLSSLGIAGRLRINVPQEAHWATKYNLCIPALKYKYNQLIAPHSVKGALREGLKMHGFTFSGPMMRDTYSYSQMREMGFQGNVAVASNYERYVSEAELALDIPVTVESLGSVNVVQTYDIEVEEEHCFYCDGFLTHNSAGMRQFSSEDELATTAKENLWMQDEDGNWRIDPERDALRMANHTRVFHHKPTLDECLAAVRKQYYSGEGAIQWAGEAKRRAQGNARYGLNPCVTADTWVHTGDGPRQVRELIGHQHSTYVNGELFSTTPDGFFYSGTKPVLKLSTKEGYSLRLTGNHKVLKVTAQTQKKQYTEWVAAEELEKGDRILLHNHRDLQPWDGTGTYEEGWLLGSLVGDGSLYTTQWNDSACLRFWEETQDEMAAYAVASLEKAVGYESRTGEAGHYHKQLKHRVINSVGLAQLAAKFDIVKGAKSVTSAVEKASYEFYRGFLRGLFDADGSVQGTQHKGVSIRLAQSNLNTLESVQRMLTRIGISATIYRNRRPAGPRMLPDSQRQLAEYHCQAQHELIIANDNLYLFNTLVGFQEPHKAEKLDTLLSGYKRKLNRERFTVTVAGLQDDGVEAVYDCTVPGVAQFDANGLVAHNCGEIIGEDFHCNLGEVHLNQIDPNNYQDQDDAFKAGAIAVAVLLNHNFVEPRYQKSREEDPIVGVSFTGLFDFFVHAFGADWLNWWAEGRPDTMTGLRFKQQEKEYLSRWRDVVHQTVWEYCDRHFLKRPNRCTTVQPAGTKSLLTGASSGWHPPKAQRFIRRITFGKNDPVALACLDYGYSIVPAQSDKDDEGRLLDDPFDPRCTEWLVEIPTEVSWANLPGADTVDISQFSALAQFDFYMQVQKYYTTHNTSATIELREPEVDALGTRIFEAIRDDEGYMSAALLARFDDHETFPRLPFEPISKATYEQLNRDVLTRRTVDDFAVAMAKHDLGDRPEEGPAGCDSDKCMLPEKKP